MADTDNLDSLSNNELRAQMIAQGLPNIPVTDSSRKVLVKRLRASLGGNASPAASPKKPSNRRETLQPATAGVPASVDKPDSSSAAASKSRRTIAAATPSEVKEIERRRPAGNKPEVVASQPVAPVAKPAPIQSRRISNTERRDAVPERVLKKPEIIAEKPSTLPKRRSPENVLDNSLIILESDEEEDEELAQAVKNAEDQYRNKQREALPTKLPTKLPPQEPQRRQQIYEPPSVTEVPRPRELPKPREVPRPREMTTQAQPSRSQATGFSQASGFNQAPSRSQAPPITNLTRSTLASSSTLGSSSYTRYSSYVSQPQPTTSYISSLSSAAATSAYPRTFANELSDDTAEEDDKDQSGSKSARFESDFARKLASLRAERIGDRSSPYNRRTIATASSGSSFEPVARRSLRPENVSLSTQFRQLGQSIGRKYPVKTIFVLIVLMLIYLAYKIYY
ncbi:otefin [Drosophila albomicans]|uniref:Otefin n=1 Tax=Drosophila albomicans TaxID=7291 RepID=A0A6P8XAW6_DROAB|nr:otefin [Drosophila albomicans]